MPRPLTGFAKAETWDNPAMAMLFDLWQAIPIRRGEVDLEAIRQALSVLQSGGILAVAPEGTRSGHGRLGRGNPGVVLLAQMSGAPLLPLVYYGGESFKGKHQEATPHRIPHRRGATVLDPHRGSIGEPAGAPADC